MSAESNTNDIELLSTYLDGQLTEAERSALESRLQNEPELRRQLAELRATVALIRELPTMAAPRDFRLTHAMVSRSHQRPQPRVYLFSVVSAAAAIVLFVVGFGLLSSSVSTTAPPALSNFASDGLSTGSLPPQVANLPTDTVLPTIDAFALRFAATDTTEQDEAMLDQAGEDARTAIDEQQAQATLPLPTATLLIAPYADSTMQAGGAAANTTGTVIEEISNSAEQADEESPQADLLLQAPTEGDAAVAPLPSQSEPAAMLALQPTDNATATPAPTLARPTATSLPTETLTSTPTSAPSQTPAPTSTMLPTPAPQPIQAPASPPDSGTLGVILIAGSIVLLAAAIYIFARNRRS